MRPELGGTRLLATTLCLALLTTVFAGTAQAHRDHENHEWDRGESTIVRFGELVEVGCTEGDHGEEECTEEPDNRGDEKCIYVAMGDPIGRCSDNYPGPLSRGGALHEERREILHVVWDRTDGKDRGFLIERVREGGDGGTIRGVENLLDEASPEVDVVDTEILAEALAETLHEADDLVKVVDESLAELFERLPSPSDCSTVHRDYQGPFC